MSEIKKLARLGGDVRKIAALLQSKGRGRDTVLAHITPQEAALLKARGGRGSTNPDTGLLEFEDDVGPIEAYQTPAPADSYTPEQTYEVPLQAQDFEAAQAPQSAADFGPEDFAFTPVEIPSTPSFRPSQVFGEGMTGAETGAFDLGLQAGAPAPAAVPPGVLQQLSQKTGMSEDFLKRLGLAGIQSIPGAIMARRAGREAGAQRAELEALARPYRAQAQQLTAGAQAGRLTPVAQQQLEAVRAQMAQQVSGRGGVGAMQSAQQIEAFRQQLLQQQLDMGLKLSGIADRIQTGAIRTGYQADQQVQQMVQNFTNNMFRTLFGQPGQQAQQQPRT